MHSENYVLVQLISPHLGIHSQKYMHGQISPHQVLGRMETCCQKYVPSRTLKLYFQCIFIPILAQAEA